MIAAQVVQLLNRPPFSKDLSLVAFDELTSYDLLSLINDIFSHLDKKNKVDLRDEPHEQMIARMLSFIKLMKFPIRGSEEDFMNQLVMGNHGVVYPLLHHLLDKRTSLEKRAYLAPFLVPIDVPAQYMVDNTVNNVYQSYRELQKEFSVVHKQYDQLRSTTMAPQELQTEIKQLSDEREQLKDKINSMKSKTQDMRGFEKIHAITSGLRKEQEEESRLEERRMEQMAQLDATTKRYEHVSRALLEMKENMKSTGTSPEQILNKERDHLHTLNEYVKKKLPSEIRHQQERLHKMESQLNEPIKSQEEVDRMHDHVRQLKNDIGRLEQSIESSASKNSNDNLGNYFPQTF
jgi:intraflagellar transport protein 81